LSAWFRQAGRERVRGARERARFDTLQALDTFFAACDKLDGPEREPDWEEHLRAIEASRSKSLP
jgi:hypothetical protein